VSSENFTVFEEQHRIASGSLAEVAAAAQGRVVLVFDDRTGRVVDLDPRGIAEPPRGRGRPKLGVVAREVTLLPRHWEWLARQPGGASVALRKLVEAAQRNALDADRLREAREAAYRFMTAMAGNLPGYEEAIRALFAGDAAGFAQQIADWPADIRDYTMELAP
jgi:hypothetical protein